MVRRWDGEMGGVALAGGGRLAAMGQRGYEVKPLNEATWPAFAALVEANNGIFGGCWCIGFHPGSSPERWCTR